jgi:hypothetical protein
MRTREIALTVLFPIFIAIGFTLGMDAVSSTEFGYARYAFQLAAALGFALSLLWFYETDFSWSVASVFVLTTSVTLAALIGALEWVYLKENTYCLITADLTNAPTPQGPYLLQATSVGPYPRLNVRVTINGKPYELGDVGSLPGSASGKYDDRPWNI